MVKARTPSRAALVGGGGTGSTGGMYRFKDITAVPDAKALVDIVLSKTQRKTPTQVHKAFKISRIRSFYARKIKFCQQTIHDKLTDILLQFPRLDDIHPFYADLCNVLYDRDHYKLALGQCNTVRGVVDTLAKDYVRLMKYADSLYKCKSLKRAALGRMCTALRKLQTSFVYLEEVRQHLARLPSISPHTRTLILAGYPNVGKSSFMNKVSNANVEVQPYAFTTKSLFLGHFDFAFARWQIIDTPGVLDRPLEDRNTIEMTAITALAHIQCAVLYVLDVSEQCGYSVREQVRLFQSLRPLFQGKPIVLVVNKTDCVKFEDIEEQLQQEIRSVGNVTGMAENGGVDDGVSDLFRIVETSTLTGDGVDTAKNAACEMLLKQRVLKKCASKRADSIANRLQITNPLMQTSGRPPFIPASVHKQRDRILRDNVNGLSNEEDESCMNTEMTEKQREEANGGPGVYSADLRRKYLLRNSDWKYDVVPEIMGGKNISDFVDPDVERKLQELEEEEMAFRGEELDAEKFDGLQWIETQKKMAELHGAIEKRRTENRLRKKRVGINVMRKTGTSISCLARHLSNLGIEPTGAVARGKMGRRRPRSRSAATPDHEPPLKDQEVGNESFSRGRRALPPRGDASHTDDDEEGNKSSARRHLLTRLRSRSQSRMSLTNPRDRSRSLAPSTIEVSIPDPDAQKRAMKIKRRKEKQRNVMGRVGEADRFIGTKKPKHLFSGKRGIGKTQRR